MIERLLRDLKRKSTKVEHLREMHSEFKDVLYVLEFLFKENRDLRKEIKELKGKKSFKSRIIDLENNVRALVRSSRSKR